MRRYAPLIAFLVIAAGACDTDSPTSTEPFSGPSPQVALAATPSTFVSVTGPIGVVANTNTLLYTQFCTKAGDPTIFSVDDAGTVSVFAPSFPTKEMCVEKYLDISPGLGGFPKDHVYVTHGREIFEITPDGSTVTVFADIGLGVVSHTGITFDREGTFGNDMIVTAVSGHVFRINSAGMVTFLATTNTFHENPEVVPVGFGPLGGQVWTAAEDPLTGGFRGKVFAISPSGDVSEVVRVRGAESVHLIPHTVCEFGSSGGAFFVTALSTSATPARIDMFPASDFATLGGQVLVTGEFSDPISLISATATGYTVSTFDPTPRRHEGGTFARCQASTIPAISQMIDDFLADGSIESVAVARALQSLLTQAAAAVDRGNNRAAANELNAFIRLVRAQSGKRIESAAATRLGDLAQALIDNL